MSLSRIEKKKILIVDSEPTLNEPLADFMIGLGIQIYQVPSLERALEHIRIQKPDLILLDYQLKSSTGTSGLESFRQHKIKIPIIVMTRDTSPQTYRGIWSQEDVCDYFIKPLDCQSLLRSAQLVLEREPA